MTLRECMVGTWKAPSERAAARRLARRFKLPEETVRGHIRRAHRLGLTIDEYYAQTRQKHACEICGRTKRVVLDHGQATGETRGWLCYGCNTGLGLFHDSERAVRRAAAYLAKYNRTDDI